MNMDRGAGLNHEDTKSTKKVRREEIKRILLSPLSFVLFMSSWLISPMKVCR